MMVIVLIQIGCLTKIDTTVEDIKIPSYPDMMKVKFEKLGEGYFLTEQDTKNLNINIERLKIYIEKLEVIIKTYQNKEVKE